MKLSLNNDTTSLTRLVMGWLTFLPFAIVFFNSVLAQPQNMTARIGAFNEERRVINEDILKSTLFKAAHPSLAFGTPVVLFHPQTQKSIIVEINDRSKSEIIITLEAAMALGVTHENAFGVIAYPQEKIDMPLPKHQPIVAKKKPSKGVFLQHETAQQSSIGIKVAQSNDYEEITRYIQLFQNLGYNNLLLHSFSEGKATEIYYRLFIGPYTDKKEALIIYKKLQDQKMPVKVVQLDKLK